MCANPIHTEKIKYIYNKANITNVVRKLQKDDYLMLIGDFHYVESNVQREITEVIKEIPHEDISIGVALVPHRSEDILRGKYRSS